MNILHHKARTSKAISIALNPFDFFIESIVRVIAYVFVPIPLAAELLVQFKGVILTILLNALLLIVVLFVLFVRSFSTSYAQNPAINLPIDGSFISTDTPLQNPLGGQGLSLVQITAGFRDPNYAFFGGNHTGVDFVPNETYFQSNLTYKETGSVVVYATMNGSVKYYVDQYGSHTVEVTNKDNSIKTIFMHLSAIFVATGDTITAGKPIGTMGNTGFSTGEHLHYEIRINENDAWTPVNPLNSIH